MKIVSAQEMREIDRATSERSGISSSALMENAGAAVATFALKRYPLARRVTVLCGKGNNGGDGFVAARKLAEAGREVQVVLLAEANEVGGDASLMLRRLPFAPRAVRSLGELHDEAIRSLFGADLLVDAILGTGFRPPVSGLYAEAIALVNCGTTSVLAVDIPSGADADAMGRQSGPIARADSIVTFTAPRPAHVFGALTRGAVVIASIGSPQEVIHSSLQLNLSTPQDMVDLLAARAVDANKGTYGHVLVVGGSLGKAGAPAMTGFAALRAGAGLATVATARSVMLTVAAFHPELMTDPLTETEEGTISLRALEYGGLDRMMEGKTVLALGPGLSRHPETTAFVHAFVARTVAPLVLDADGLNAFADCPEKLNGELRPLIITPHPGEMARLCNCSVAEVQASRMQRARSFAHEHAVTVVLKGHRTLVATPGGEVWVNPTGNPGMATGGTGDVLTGMIAGCVAQNPGRALEATVLAVYLHGLAGDLASDQVGERSLVASDLIRAVPDAIRKTQSHCSGEWVEFHA